MYDMRARALASACLPAASAGPLATAAPALSATRRQRRKVDKCRVADKKKTDRQTNQQINTHYSFIGIDGKRTAREEEEKRTRKTGKMIIMIIIGFLGEV